MEKQKAVFINTIDHSQTLNIEEIARNLLKIDKLPIPVVTKYSEIYSWQLNTKYYTANIDISILKEKSIVTEEFSQSVEAVLVYFDSEKCSQGLKSVKSWLPFLDTWQPSIKLAVCEKCDRDGRDTISRVSVQEWCLENEFELVEMNPDPEDYDEFEEVGIKRIQSALMAHMWPDMTMKNPQNAVKKIQPNCGVDVAKGVVPASMESIESTINGLLGTPEFDDILEKDADEDDFENLFSKMRIMKDKADALPGEDRKKYAENVVKAFWSALGGDDEELEGISSEEENPEIVDEAAKR